MKKFVSLILLLVLLWALLVRAGLKSLLCYRSIGDWLAILAGVYPFKVFH